MKLKRITIHNIASIADAEIDFVASPLADTPLFLMPCGKFFVQLFDGSLVLVVLLPILGCIFHTCIGDLLDK